MFHVLVRVTILAVVAICGFGCGKGDAPATATVESSVASPPPRFPTIQSLLDHLKTLKGGEGRIELLDLTYVGNNLVEQTSVRFERSIAGARLEYARAVNEAFAAPGTEIVDTDFGMSEFAGDLENYRLEKPSDYRTEVVCTRNDGSERIFHVINVDGSWHVHCNILRHGKRLTPEWYGEAQFRFMGELQYHRDTAREVREGRFKTAEEAENRLQQRLNGPMPAFGSVQPD